MADFNEYKGVWVFCEQRQGALMSTDFELVSEARKLADELGVELGGILLGAGGLVRAYAHGAKIAVDAAGRSIKRIWTNVYLPCPYSWYERIRLEVAAFGGMIRETQFGADVELDLLLPEEQTAAKRVLTAAALTYVAALSVTIMQFLRLLLIVAGGNRRRD